MVRYPRAKEIGTILRRLADVLSASSATEKIVDCEVSAEIPGDPERLRVLLEAKTRGEECFSLGLRLVAERKDDPF